MTLAKGQNTIRANVNTLMQGVRSPARAKAIATIARKNNLSYRDAMFYQAKKIAIKQSRKK